MREDRSIKVSKEKRDEMVSAIKNFFSKERGEEIGDLAAGFFLKFVLDELAPEFYNQGVSDAHKYMLERAEDLLSIQK
jgi:uncharacterized protein (DUF2164 family)